MGGCGVYLARFRPPQEGIENVNPIRLSLAILAFAAAGCRCDGGTMKLKPDYLAMPTAVNFSACPTKDELNMPVADVFPNEQTVTVSNKGKAGGTFAAVLSGADAALRSEERRVGKECRSRW